MPKKVCDEVNGKIASFWWGQKKEERKIHWISWLTMTNSKGKWGMGFKDMNLLNIALLAKQSWMMLMNPENWWVRIIKGIYFPKCSILKAKKGWQMHYGHGQV